MDIYGLGNARAAHAGARPAVCKLKRKKNWRGFAGSTERLQFHFSLDGRDLLLGWCFGGFFFLLFLRAQNSILFGVW